MPNGMAMSPGVEQQGNQPPAPDQAEAMFKERFNQMAFSVLYAKFSEIAPNVVTFKILEIDPEAGKGIGVFIILHNQKPIYVPVVLADGQLKPMDMFFYKELNIFLPLTTQWLDEISKMSMDEMGHGANLPNEVPQDVNIRDLILPPMTTSGRIGYANDMSRALIDFDAKALFKAAEDHSQLRGMAPKFLEVLAEGPKVLLDGMKIAFERRPGLLQKFTSVYGVNALTGAFQRGYAKNAALTKTASAKPSLRVFTKYSSADVLRETFGSDAGTAYQEILKQGYAVKDTRRTTKVAMKVEGKVALTEPGATGGWFKLYFVDSPADDYLVIPFPKGDHDRCLKMLGSSGGNYHRTPVEYLVVNKNLKEAWESHDIAGEQITETEKVKSSPLYKLLFSSGDGDTPKIGSTGFFVNLKNRTVESTGVITIKYSMTSGGIRKYKQEYGATYVIDDDPSRMKIDVAMGSDLIFLPKDVKWVSLRVDKLEGEDHDAAYERRRKNEWENKKNSVITDPKLIMRWLNAKLHESGAQEVHVKNAGINQYWIEKISTPLSFADALEKVATLYDISAVDAVGILKDAQEHGRSYSFALDLKAGKFFKAALDKWAQPPTTPMMPPNGDPTQQQPPPGTPPPQGDPNAAMQTGDPNAAPQEQAPPPAAAPPSAMSPTDLAIGEAVQQLQQQNEMMSQQLQQQAQSLQQQIQTTQQSNQQVVSVLQSIQQRASQISAATNGQIPPEAMQSPAMAAQALAPVPPQEAPTPPMPMMDRENTSPEMVAEQINPQLAEQASEFNDQGMFDTAAIGMLASAPVLQDIVATYIPNLEKAIDNIGRIILTLWMREDETKEQIGDDTYVSLEDKLRSVFKNLGEVVLSVAHNALTNQDPNAPAPVGGTHSNV
jgi:DNA-binding transcriptional MerR regulator